MSDTRPNPPSEFHTERLHFRPPRDCDCYAIVKDDAM